jgi:hypothetical protein
MEAFGMMRRVLALGVLCGLLAVARPAQAQGVWFGGVGFGGPGFYGSGFSPYGFGNAGFYGGFAPARFGYPVVVRPVYGVRAAYGVRPVYGVSPVVPASFAPVYRARPAVQAPLNRASRRIWRRGW